MAKTKVKGKNVQLASEAKKVVRDFTPKKPKKSQRVFITPDLEKKDKLTMREQIWVYNAEIAMLLGFLNLCGAIAVGSALSPQNGLLQTLNILWGVGGVALLVIGALESQHRAIGGAKVLTHKDRKQQRFAERQRAKTGHAIERYGRYGAAEVKYNHFSTRITSEGRTVTLTIIEHIEVKDGKFRDVVVELNDIERVRLLVPQAVQTYEKNYKQYEEVVRRFQEEHAAWGKRKQEWVSRTLRNIPRNYEEMTNDYEPQEPPAPPAPTGQLAVKQITRKNGESKEDFEGQVQHWKNLFDQIASAFEQQAYQTAREELEVKQIALEMRD